MASGSATYVLVCDSVPADIYCFYSVVDIEVSRRRFLCLDCGIDTGKIHEHYFVHTTLWMLAVGSISGMLCIEHLEQRIGRRLIKSDFPLVTINDPKYGPKSQRLMERMNVRG